MHEVLVGLFGGKELLVALEGGDDDFGEDFRLIKLGDISLGDLGLTVGGGENC